VITTLVPLMEYLLVANAWNSRQCSASRHDGDECWVGANQHRRRMLQTHLKVQRQPKQRWEKMQVTKVQAQYLGVTANQTVVFVIFGLVHQVGVGITVLLACLYDL